jgi:phosphoribosyl 1,2-cyclic phosphodiesterase
VRVVSLASGSSGNAFWVQAGATSILLDAGLGPRIVAQRLAAAGGDVTKLTAVVLTHEHVDHVRGLAALVRRYRVPVVATPGTLAAALGTDGEQCALPLGSEVRVGELVVRALAVQHDAEQPAALEIAHDGTRVLVAVDIGTVGDELVEHGRLADLLIVDCNHDQERLWNGPYPAALKRRVAGPRGHLSNDQAAAFVAACASDRPQAVWLAHLSAVNNTPTLARTVVCAVLTALGVARPVLVAARDRLSLDWRSDEMPAAQLGLPWPNGAG